MLLFIFRQIVRECFCCSISIHLMLLFIRSFRSITNAQSNFNTSHVTVYPRPSQDLQWRSTFQYISCYCLSVIKSYKGFNKDNFNTSHVTVYHDRGWTLAFHPEFQYISCYCLSLTLMVCNSFRMISIHLMLLFIFLDSVLLLLE